MRNSYSAYVGHATRFYLSNPTRTTFKSDTDKLNFVAVKKVFEDMNASDRRLLIACYTSANMVEEIKELAKIYNLKPSAIWRKIVRYEKYVAIKRGLL